MASARNERADMPPVRVKVCANHVADEEFFVNQLCLGGDGVQLSDVATMVSRLCDFKVFPATALWAVPPEVASTVLAVLASALDRLPEDAYADGLANFARAALVLRHGAPRLALQVHLQLAATDCSPSRKAERLLGLALCLADDVGDMMLSSMFSGVVLELGAYRSLLSGRMHADLDYVDLVSASLASSRDAKVKLVETFLCTCASNAMKGRLGLSVNGLDEAAGHLRHLESVLTRFDVVDLVHSDAFSLLSEVISSTVSNQSLGSSGDVALSYHRWVVACVKVFARTGRVLEARRMLSAVFFIHGINLSGSTPGEGVQMHFYAGERHDATNIKDIDLDTCVTVMCKAASKRLWSAESGARELYFVKAIKATLVPVDMAKMIDLLARTVRIEYKPFQAVELALVLCHLSSSVSTVVRVAGELLPELDKKFASKPHGLAFPRLIAQLAAITSKLERATGDVLELKREKALVLRAIAALPVDALDGVVSAALPAAGKLELQRNLVALVDVRLALDANEPISDAFVAQLALSVPTLLAPSLKSEPETHFGFVYEVLYRQTICALPADRRALLVDHLACLGVVRPTSTRLYDACVFPWIFVACEASDSDGATSSGVLQGLKALMSKAALSRSTFEALRTRASNPTRRLSTADTVVLMFSDRRTPRRVAELQAQWEVRQAKAWGVAASALAASAAATALESQNSMDSVD